MEDMFGIKFDAALGTSEIVYDSPDYRDIPSINMDDFIYDKSNAPKFEMMVDI